MEQGAHLKAVDLHLLLGIIIRGSRVVLADWLCQCRLQSRSPTTEPLPEAVEAVGAGLPAAHIMSKAAVAAGARVRFQLTQLLDPLGRGLVDLMEVLLVMPETLGRTRRRVLAAQAEILLVAAHIFIPEVVALAVVGVRRGLPEGMLSTM